LALGPGSRTTPRLSGKPAKSDRTIAHGELDFEGVNTDPWGNTKAAFAAETEINRKDFGLEWNVALETGGVLVSDKVKVQLDIQAVKA